MSTLSKLGALAAIAALAPGLAAASAVDMPQVYGRADLSYQSEKAGNADAVYKLSSNSSRLGFWNEHALSDSLAVIYRLEFEVDIEERRRSEDRGFMRSRNSYLGLTGSWGTAFFGIHDTPMKKAEGKIDLFSDYYLGDMDEILQGQERVSDSLNYISPKFGGGFTTWLMLVPGEGNADESGTQEAATGDSPADAFVASLTYSGEMLWAALAYQNALGKAGAELDIIRASAQISHGPFKFGAIVQQAELSSGNAADGLGFLVSAQLDLNGVDILKAQFTSAEDESLEELPGGSMFTLGWDHKFSKQTKLYAYLTDISANDKDAERSAFGLGLRHDFGKSK